MVYQTVIIPLLQRMAPPVTKRCTTSAAQAAAAAVAAAAAASSPTPLLGGAAMGHCGEGVLAVMTPGGGQSSAAAASTPQTVQNTSAVMFSANSRAESVANSMISDGEVLFRKDLKNGRKKPNGTGMMESTLNDTADRMSESSAVRELNSIDLVNLDLSFDANDDDLAQANKFCAAFL